jgi:hypothetical protein
MTWTGHNLYGECIRNDKKNVSINVQYIIHDTHNSSE